MAKTRTSYFCQNCGSESSKWVGKCSVCGEWNTMVEELISKSKTNTNLSASNSIFSSKPTLISQVSTLDVSRIHTSSQEFDRVLGGGIVPGSLILVGGEPGIGKSTLVLQVALNLNDKKVLYISGEESPQQIKLRADRLGFKDTNCYVVSETNLEEILIHIENLIPEIVIIDSIQTLNNPAIESAVGSVSQIRECTNRILVTAKQRNIPVILIGHINKEGSIAGPKVLEHMVDVVLQFEGDRNHIYRILRSIKNRFGSTSEIGIFEMENSGLKEVLNPSELLLSHHNESLSGISIAAAVEGLRPFLIEVQALASTAAYGTPQRSSTGFDSKRLNMLLAVLEKRAGFKLATKDVFLNIAGGLKVNDPSIDLAVVASILSSSLDLPIPSDICVAGEIGLSGEIRPISRIEQRIGEASKLGFKRIVIPKSSKKIVTPKSEIKIIEVGKIEEAFAFLLT
ncbi:MAG: DNA repair protein RadA [Breznakibacter sp.]|nr:DNA repair protein RadA [Breznakibacter sp.]